MAGPTALTGRTIADALAGLAAGTLPPRELTVAHPAAMGAARNRNAFVAETPEPARGDAGAAGARRARGEAGLLDGVPLAIKDLFCTRGVLSTAASHILDAVTP